MVRSRRCRRVSSSRKGNGGGGSRTFDSTTLGDEEAEGGLLGGDGRVGKRPVVAFLMAVAAGRRNGHPFGFGLRKVNVAL